MSLTLIVEDNIQLQDFYHLNLFTWVGTEVICVSDAKFAANTLSEKGKEVSLIITRHKIGPEKTHEALTHSLKDLGLKIPIINLGAENLQMDGVIFLRSGIDIKEIIKASAKFLGVTAQSMSRLEVEEYFPVPIQHFNHLNIAICPIYQERENQIYQENELIDPMKLKSDVASGLNHYFVHKNDRLKFVSNYNEVIASKLDLIELNKDERMQATELSHNLLRENLNKFGINEETVQLANKNLKEMIQTTKSTPSLLRFIKRLMQNKAGFHFKHTQVLMFVSAHLMDHLDWGTEEQKAKMQFIAYFHDIALENDVQARIHSNDELRRSDLPPKKKDLVKKHAMLAATLVSQYPNAPMGVEQIIKQHHGSLNGVGFSDHYSQNISPMAIVHVLAEDFVTEIIESGKDFDVPTQIKRMREKYTTQRFQKIIDVLDTIAV